MYNKITQKDIDALQKFAQEKILAFEEISEDYSHDELGGIEHYPDVLIKVKSTKEVSDIMKYAYENNFPVVVRGSGTGLVGGAVAINGGIMIETTLMNKFLELDENNLTLRLQPGVLLMDIAEYVEPKGFFYPPDPGEKSATIGGNISTNAGGMRAVKYGVTRDYVRALTVVLPNGDVMELGGKVVKNSSGYALKDLVIGSEGTLCVITEAILKLISLPQYSVSLLVPFETMSKALNTVPHIVRSKVLPTAIEYLTKDVIGFAETYLGKQFPDKSSDAYLLLTFDGSSKASVDFEMDIIAQLCLEHGALDAFIVDTDERKKSVWSARGAFLEAIKAGAGEMDECDVVVPRDKIADFIEYTHEIAKKLNIRIPSFGHAGDGNLHIYMCKDDLSDEEFEKVLKEGFELMYDYAAKIGGLVSGEHGIGFAKKQYMFDQYGDVQMTLMRGIKATFDEKNILNASKVV